MSRVQGWSWKAGMLALCLAALTSVGRADERATEFVDFTGTDGTIYDIDDFEYDFGNVDFLVSAPELKIYNNSLRIKLPANLESRGVVTQMAIPGSDDYWVRSKITFPAGFNWGTSNDIKLPCGLGGGTLPTGGSTDKTNGWSARMMRNGGSQHLVVYAYDTHRGTWGSVYDTGVTLAAGTTYDIVMYVKRNTASTSNGILRVWVDGVQKINLTNRKWSHNQVNVDTIIFDCFRGGAGTPPTVDTYVYVEEFEWDQDLP